MHIKEKNKVLLAALFISISAHASGLYLLWPSVTQNTWVRPGQIQVNVIASKSKESGVKKILKKNNEAVRNKLQDTLKPDSFSQNTDSASSDTKTTPSSLSNTLIVQLRGKIKTALQEHLTYPPIARRRGWQGTVTIHVTVRSNGDLQQVKLSKSSGYSLLDNSAITALRKVGHLDGLKPLLQGKTIPIELPIRYLLEDSEYGTPSV